MLGGRYDGMDERVFVARAALAFRRLNPWRA